MVAMALNWDLVLTQVVAMAPNQDHFKATETASHWRVVPSTAIAIATHYNDAPCCVLTLESAQ